jgi:hypothetical protein
MEIMCQIICHIVGLTNSLKQQFIKKMGDINYNIVDLDELSNSILKNNNMIQLFKQYQVFKNSKNDKFKDIDKKMTLYWETSMEENILERLDKNRKNIIIGYNHHFRNINKHIKFPESKPIGKFILKVTKSDVRGIITYNLDKHRDDIIRGAYPLNNIDFDLIYTNRQKIDSVYEKNNYLPKTLDTLYTILELGSKDKDKNISLWIASTQPYNIGSKMYPSKNDKLFAFTEQIMALLSSFNFNEDELEKTFDNNIIKVRPKKVGVLEKMREKRYLYLVDKISFIPHEKGNNVKFFSQEPAIILEMIKISNVYDEYFANK